MAFHSLRLRRVFSVSSSLLRQSLNRQSKQISPIRALSHLLSNTGPSSTDAFGRRPFTSTTSLFLTQRNKVFDPATDEIGPDTILFEGCDYNHWLITVDFPKDEKVTREQMIDTYVNTAAQVFGSVEEAKKNIYALSTTTYQGFQVVCSEETSEKFKGLPGVVFVLPDSYIDPVNKEYGGDKYVNGEIFPRPPPVHYGRTTARHDRNRQPQQQNYGPPPNRDYRQPQQNYGRPPPQQNYGPPPPQQNYGPPPPQQNYGPPPPQQNYGPPPPQQNYGPPPPQQNYRPPPPQQNNRAQQSQQNYGPPPPQNYGPPQQQNYGPHQQQPNFPPRQNYGPPDSGERRGPMPPQNNSSGGDGSYNGNLNQRNFGQV